MSSDRHEIIPQGAEPCVWMSAGLVSYKLCDRDFDCKHCPLDGALRGGTPDGNLGSGGLGNLQAGRVDARGTAAAESWGFPPDRYYSPGHLWLESRSGNNGQSEEGVNVYRIGLDALAAALLGPCRGVRYVTAPRDVASGESFCDLELDVGRLSLGAPIAGRLSACNDALGGDPAMVLSEPYEAGWLAEVSVPTDSAPPTWLSGSAAEEQSEMDLRRFRRGAALRMLVDRELGPVMADGGNRLTDLRQMLGAAAYLELLRDLVH